MRYLTENFLDVVAPFILFLMSIGTWQLGIVTNDRDFGNDLAKTFGTIGTTLITRKVVEGARNTVRGDNQDVS